LSKVLILLVGAILICQPAAAALPTGEEDALRQIYALLGRRRGANNLGTRPQMEPPEGDSRPLFAAPRGLLRRPPAAGAARDAD